MSNLVNSALAARLVLTLVHSLWEGAAIAVLASAAPLAFGRSLAALRYRIYFAALVLTALAAAVTFVHLAPPPDVAPRPITASAAPAVGMTGFHEAITPSVQPMSRSAAPPTRINAPATPKLDWKRYATPLVELYAAGVLFMLIRLSLAIQGGRRLRIAARPITDRSILDASRRQAERLGLRYIPAVLYSGRVLVPTVVGILRPVILLPVSVSTGLATEAIEAILAHELAHIRRHDHLLQLAQRLLEAVFFYHAAVWYLSRRIHAERENACDDLAAGAVGGERDDYAAALVAAAEACAVGRSAAGGVGLAMARSAGALRQRVERLMEPVGESRFRLPGVAAAGGVFVAAVIVVLGCTQTRAVGTGNIEDDGAVKFAGGRIESDGSGVDDLQQALPGLVVDYKVRARNPTIQPAQRAAATTEPSTVTRTYDIRDLLTSAMVDPAKAAMGEGYATREQAAHALMLVIYSHIAPSTWIANGGKIGTLGELQGDLIVTTTPVLQEEITNLLKQIRDQRPDATTATTRPFPKLSSAPSP